MTAKLWHLSLIIATRGLEVPENEEIFDWPERASGEKRPFLEDASQQLLQQVAQQRVAYETADKLAHELAQSLRQTPDDAKKTELRTAVRRAFTLRQSLLRAELWEMQARLEKTQQSLDMRERISDQIVDRRVEDLLNPQLKWEQELSGERKNQAGLDAQLQPESSLDDVPQ